jgi:hypothetical protein
MQKKEEPQIKPPCKIVLDVSKAGHFHKINNENLFFFQLLNFSDNPMWR